MKVALALALVAALAVASPSPAAGPAEPIEVSAVNVALTEQGPVVLLKARNRVVPIFVDESVASSIQGALSGQKFPRPLSHDLMKTILEAYKGKVTRVAITLKEGVFYADLTISVNGTEKIFDSRSSDAIALAVRFKAPIFVGEDLLDSAGKMMPGAEGQML